MYSPIKLSYFLQYLTNAENVIYSLFITSKYTVTLPNNFVYMQI
jgi:hypothetical protein